MHAFRRYIRRNVSHRQTCCGSPIILKLLQKVSNYYSKKIPKSQCDPWPCAELTLICTQASAWSIVKWQREGLSTLFMWENVCSQIYVDQKAAHKANTMFLRQPNFSSRDIQQVEIQVLWSCLAVVSSCFYSFATFVTHSVELFSSVTGVIMFTSRSIRDESSSYRSKLCEKLQFHI